MSQAAAHLRRNREGVLLADGLALGVRFVIDGGTGRLVFPAEGAVMQAEELVLFVPRESPVDDHELQLLLSAAEAPEAAADRWMAYHGTPSFNVFGSFGIEDAKYDGEVVEEPMSEPNPLAAVEGKLCRRLNSDRAALGAVCRRVAGVDVKEPLAVGVDGLGLDIKARFGIVRIELGGRVEDLASAERAIDELLKGGAP